MKAIFMTILNWLDESENVTEALMYENGEFARVKFETGNGKYTLSISKEEKNDGNNGN